MALEMMEQDTFAIDEFLAVEAAKDLLRFSTAGSVDDGKSTLIGRLLYDSRNVYEDQVRAITGKQALHATQAPSIDFALLTDGLRAEREQGITIDVAYRYFSTTRRKFIIADTPGHEQYTRNMATGASTADLAIILIDARKGILTQSRRHAYIASLLGIRHLVAAINKMDLVDFAEEVYTRIEAEFRALVGGGAHLSLQTIPVSALLGDNVVDRSEHMPWYPGPTLLEHLEAVPVWTDVAAQAFRLPVQRVIRPDQHFRGFAGRISAGTVRKGDTVVALPSGRTSRVASIVTFDGELTQASAPLSVTLTLEDELDISRGDLLSEPARLPRHATVLEASVVWFDGQRLETQKPYLLKHAATTLPARVTEVRFRTNVQTLEAEAVSSLAMNDLGVVEMELARPLYFDPYTTNRASGSFILIDPQSNATVAAGMIRGGHAASNVQHTHKPALVVARAGVDVAALEEALLAQGGLVVRTRLLTLTMLEALLSHGLLVLVESAPDETTYAALSARGFAWVEIGLENKLDDWLERLRDLHVLAPRTREEGN